MKYQFFVLISNTIVRERLNRDITASPLHYLLKESINNPIAGGIYSRFDRARTAEDCSKGSVLHGQRKPQPYEDWDGIGFQYSPRPQKYWDKT
jgi:hypothetical protein